MGSDDPSLARIAGMLSSDGYGLALLFGISCRIEFGRLT